MKICNTVKIDKVQKVAIMGVSETLGIALVSGFIRKGWDVFISSRNGNKLEKIANSVKHMGRIFYAAGDLTSREEIGRVMEKAMDSLGSIDCLVIQVGGYGEDNIENPNQLLPMLESHVSIPVNVSSTALRFMKSGSSIILFSSVVSLSYPDPEKLSYSLAKSAINSMTLSMASFLLEKGIRVNAVAPYSIGGSTEDYMLGETHNPPDLISNAVTWLAGSESMLVDGVVLPVDGGNRLRH
jgi:NAD(P)-dependent dehydrogenase (short-subunit alcohol dehydrogenase family)